MMGLAKRLGRGYVDAPYGWLELDTAQCGVGGPANGTEFDLTDACRKCGSGARQLGPLRLSSDGQGLPTRESAFFTVDDELIIRRDLVERAPTLMVAGDDVVRPLVVDGDESEVWVQLVPGYVLPRMSRYSWTSRDLVCDVCDRDGLYTAGRTEIRYDDLLTDEIPAVVTTYELVGSGLLCEPFAKSRLAHPLLVFEERLQHELLDAGLTRAKFTPIQVRQPS